MKALVRKEFRENVKLAVLGLVIYTLMLFQQYRSDVVSPRATGQPLVSGAFLMSTAWFCGIFGAVLGWLQIHNERRPDLWAFLIHRPVTRTTIFLGKVIAGLGLYAVVAGLPLLGFIVWARLPGRVAAPFEPAMLLPVTAYFLAGTVSYFAGMLTGLRQARWYGSRALGLGVALIVVLIMAERPEFWQGLLIIFIGAAMLITGTWGAFQSQGYYRGQPAGGKAALTATLTFGKPGCCVCSGPNVVHLLPEKCGLQAAFLLCHDRNRRGLQGDDAFPCLPGIHRPRRRATAGCQDRAHD
jgi:hypothetical protein